MRGQCEPPVPSGDARPACGSNPQWPRPFPQEVSRVRLVYFSCNSLGPQRLTALINCFILICGFVHIGIYVYAYVYIYIYICPERSTRLGTVHGNEPSWPELGRAEKLRSQICFFFWPGGGGSKRPKPYIYKVWRLGTPPKDFSKTKKQKIEEAWIFF